MKRWSWLLVLAACGEAAPSVVKEPPPPGLLAAPRWLTYTCVEPGCDSMLTSEIAVIGDRDVAIKRIVLSDKDRDDFTFTSSRDTPFVLKAGEKFTVDVRFVPTGDPRLGDVNLELTYTDASASESDPDRLDPGQLELPLVRRQIGEPKLAATPTELNFGAVRLSAEKSLPLMVANEGFGNVGLLLEPLESDHPGEISFEALPEAALLPGQSHQVQVTYRPAEEAFLQGVLRVAAVGADVAPTMITVLGTSISVPTIAVAPELGVDFGEVPAPSIGQAVLSLTNRGAEPLVINGVELVSAVAGGVLTFALPRGATTATIAALETLPITLSLEAQQPGEVRTALRIRSNDAARPFLEVPVLGVMTKPIIQVNPGSIDFSNVPRGWTLVRPIEVTNIGYGALVIDSVQMILGSSELFSLRTIPPLPVILQHDQRVGLELEFRSEVEASFAGTLAINSNDAVTPFIEVPMTAVGASCDLGCPITNGVPTCSAGVCAVDSCNPGFYDADRDPASGCECQEYGSDPGGFCVDATYLGTLADGNNDRATFTGIVPADDDVDIIRFFGADETQFLTDDFDVRVTLESTDPGIGLCVYYHETGNHSQECYFNNENCPTDRSYRRDGSLGPDDSADFVIKVFRLPGSAPTCTTYTVFARNG
ncbi:MAG: choice-of-anchor D domain-containing protein [Deltaproteobacteria bacterium]|nr:choice-of-anchor D domain-containing protein [Deltaproteobacteria bacterium]